VEFRVTPAPRENAGRSEAGGSAPAGGSALRVGLIGFGEVGQILAADLAAAGAVVMAWDLQFTDPASSPARVATPATRARDSAEAVRGARLVISAVTADQTLAAATEAARGLAPPAFYLDLNSVSPATKREAASIIDRAGGRYVESAVMSSFPKRRLATPMLLGGAHAPDLVARLQPLGFASMTVFSPEIGPAAAAKMCRSVMVKGIEALLMESLLTARHFGVADTVLASLAELLPGPDWAKLAPYMLGRSMQHGRRRAEEMREVAATVAQAGLMPALCEAVAARQDRAAALASAREASTLPAMLDAMRALLAEHEETERC
jgi:3-hydroxyisobutyrate dehydrogenase-like beta-hydroxyacid dehydrogenase